MTTHDSLLLSPIEPSPQRWPTVSTRNAGDFRIFSIRSDVKVNPRTGQKHDFYILDTTDWVNIIAITPEERIVMVEQYRHGSDAVELEIPGGMMERHETDPVEAGLRELREETGYVGERPQLIGRINPNAAIMSNVCHTLLVENCRRMHKVEFDSGEDLVTRLVPIGELRNLVSSGRIQHALVAVALYHFDLWRQRQAAG